MNPLQQWFSDWASGLTSGPDWLYGATGIGTPPALVAPDGTDVSQAPLVSVDQTPIFVAGGNAIASAGNDISSAVSAVTDPIGNWFSSNEGWFIGGGILLALLLVVVLIHEVDML